MAQDTSGSLIDDAGAMPGATRRERSDHFDGRRFFNPGGGGEARGRDVLRWMLNRKRGLWPKRIEDPRQPAPVRAGADEIAITFIGHATFLIQVGGLAILTDPIWSERCSPVSFAGPKRVRPAGQPLDALPDIDILLVSHNHYDHLDLPTLRNVKRLWSPPTVTGIGTGRTLAKAGLSRATELDWWDSVTVKGAHITYIPARHFSARGLHDRNRALWGGFVIEAGGSTVLFAADTGYGPHFRDIAARWPAIDVALIPIGAYNPRSVMRPVHMDPDEAVRAHVELRPKRSFGMHFGTFRDLTDEPIDEPEARLAEAARQAGLDADAFTTLPFGGTHVIRREG